MPIYEYECLDCNLKFEYLLRTAGDTVVCPHCNRKRLRRLMSAFSFSSKDAGGNVTSSSSGCSTCGSHNCSSCSN